MRGARRGESMKKFFAYIKKRPLALCSVVLLALLYFAMIFADFIATHVVREDVYVKEICE